jgi:class 3 adenylate cyclase
VPEASELRELLPAADVVAFAGHMIDAAGRAVPRFPAALVPEVQAALRDALADLRDPVIYTSAACGADLLLIEAALERSCEVNLVLPFDRDDFVRTSVAVGGDAWVRRFDAALTRASRVIMATEEGYLGDDALFAHAATFVEGLAMLRAAQLQTAPRLLCLFDPADAARVGGTRESLERWTRNVGPPHVIDLRELRQRSTAAGEPVAVAQAAPASPFDSAERPARALKTMLFADFAGYSRLHDAFAPLFQTRFLEIGARIIEQSTMKPLEAKTWGDAVYAVFESPVAGAEFALRFLERMLETDWTAAGLPSTSQVRIALHAGPVFRAFDPVMGRDGHFGSSVTRAARIEPVTPPGMVYASEAFAATLAATGQRGFALEYIGKLALAKGYGESRIYRVGRH